MNVGDKFTKIRKFKVEDILLKLDNILSNNINKYYNVFNKGNYFEISRKCFCRNKKDEYIILLNLKDRIINVYIMKINIIKYILHYLIYFYIKIKNLNL